MKTSKIILSVLVVVLLIIGLVLLLNKDKDNTNEPTTTKIYVIESTGDTIVNSSEYSSEYYSENDPRGSLPISETTTVNETTETNTEETQVSITDKLEIVFDEEKLKEEPIILEANRTGIKICDSGIYEGIPEILIPYIISIPTDCYIGKMYDNDTYLTNHLGEGKIYIYLYRSGGEEKEYNIPITIIDSYEPKLNKETYLYTVNKEYCSAFTSIKDKVFGEYTYVETLEDLFATNFSWTFDGDIVNDTENAYHVHIKYRDNTGIHSFRYVRYFEDKEKGKKLED